ncbi:hypothetical protein BDN72DRAFT_894595 [Pluteus cervinus]|uniref:Uncharacterized protein n=1 Tax=Pluteus cervinus TaxID=181527 RepID=A0ACD3B3H7_9AGAR|nr:hypothetical protein BDN72DRAFT_894595 [Pluteus cervinus]
MQKPCGWCGAWCPTRRGVQSHISQTPACHEKQKEFLKRHSEYAFARNLALNSEAAANLSPAPENSKYHEDQEMVDAAGFQGSQDPEPTGTSRKRNRTTIEEIVDKDCPGVLPAYAKQGIYVQDFPKEKEAGKPSDSAKTSFEEYRESQKSKGLEPWAPFEYEEDWEHFRWMVESNISWGNIDRYLRLKKVRDGLDLPQKMGQSFRRLLDKLPKGPKFTCTPLEVTGNIEGLTLPDGTIQYLGETLELWHRDPVSCIRELISNPSFKEHLKYAPEKHFRNPDGTNQEYDEMWTGDWWWDTQYYSRFEVHTDESLSALDSAWVSLHQNKDIFETLEIRKHFNISKLHNIKHYVDSIRSRGTTDGYNTEASERLHIDYVKMGYRASNKRNYIVQMTAWLARREAVQRFVSYLQWAVPGYHAECGEEDSEQEEEDDSSEDLEDGADPKGELERKNEDEEEDEDDDELTTTTDTPRGRIYSMACQAPALPSIPTIENEYHAQDFGWYLEQYLTKAGIAFNAIAPATHFPVYKQFTIQHPSFQEAVSEPSKDIVSAQLATPDKRMIHGGVKKGTPVKTSTVLVRTNAMEKRKSPFPTDGLSIARVRLIFGLPKSIGRTPMPLAYVNWFRPLQRPSVENGMYKVSLDKRSQYIHSGVIPITDILQTCHLIPKFGASVDDSWNPKNVLDKAASFYLNPYLRIRDFVLFRYQVWRSQQRESEIEEEREQRRKRARFALTLE